MKEEKQPHPKAGDIWEFRLPDKPKRVKEVGRVTYIYICVERGTFPKWKDKLKRILYVHWSRANKGRYTGITVKRLQQFGKRISTKAERDAHLRLLIENAKQKRQAERSKQ